MHVYQPSPFTPRHLRRRGGASDDAAKKKAFARAAKWSKRFIFQSASTLAKSPLSQDYHDWMESSRKGNLRKAGGK